MTKTVNKNRATNLTEPDWFKPDVYNDWVKGATAGKLLIEILTRVDFLKNIDSNISDFDGSMEIERNHFLDSINNYGLIKWASRAKRAELRANAKAIYSPVKPVAIDDVVMAIKRIQAKGQTFTFTENRAGETILHTAQMRNHPVDFHLSDEMWLKIDLRNLSSDQFALEAKLYSLLYSDLFAPNNQKLPFMGRNYINQFKKLIDFNPLVYLDLVIWKVVTESAFSKQNMVNCFFEAKPNLFKADPENFFNRTVSSLMESMLGVDASGTVINDMALKKLSGWLASWNSNVGCSFASIPLNEF
ncbi:DUF6387 family protein [Rheinheimera maricola]|uniref:DUF6387 family protein n=1 Tax=Rheinheimera maricola TaxID=2793282 RepID=A0ABS7XAZ3_9GAMM|nr:DUF6387 family protein [Rheinheimera maricola]MBZ9612712.1 DUF6387 family protein [Rheinheimera maricola]